MLVKTIIELDLLTTALLKYCKYLLFTQFTTFETTGKNITNSYRTRAIITRS